MAITLAGRPVNKRRRTAVGWTYTTPIAFQHRASRATLRGAAMSRSSRTLRACLPVALLVTLALAAPGSAASPTCLGKKATIIGTDEADDLVGTDGPDVILALDGDDAVDALGGDDVICGGDGRDELQGGDGDDVLSGGGGDDASSGGIVIAIGAPLDLNPAGEPGGLHGGPGDDRLLGDDGDDSLFGDAGDDASGTALMAITRRPWDSRRFSTSISYGPGSILKRTSPCFSALLASTGTSITRPLTSGMIGVVAK